MNAEPARGDRVIITDSRGFVRYGFVHTAINYGTANDPDWYVEWYDQMWKGYHYTKQKIDGIQHVQFRKPE